MSLKLNLKHCIKAKEYLLWTPDEGDCVEVGPEREKLRLPQIPLPIHREDLEEGRPSTDAVGRGVYDYLRRFSDDPYSLQYAELLRDGFSHYLADIGAQILMLDHKEVDAAYIRRKIAGMQILLLLDPKNPGLLQRLGIEFYELGLMFSELNQCRPHLLKALGYLQRSLENLPDNPTTLNYLGQIDHLFGDYPAAGRRWQGVIDQVADPATREAFSQKIKGLEPENAPEAPLVDDLEAIGEAMSLYGRGEVEEAKTILEVLEESSPVPREFPSPEFYYFLGMCRGKAGDQAGAFEAFERSLALEPEYQPAIEAKEAILDGKGF